MAGGQRDTRVEEQREKGVLEPEERNVRNKRERIPGVLGTGCSTEGSTCRFFRKRGRGKKKKETTGEYKESGGGRGTKNMGYHQWGKGKRNSQAYLNSELQLGKEREGERVRSACRPLSERVV